MAWMSKLVYLEILELVWYKSRELENTEVQLRKTNHRSMHPENLLNSFLMDTIACFSDVALLYG